MIQKMKKSKGFTLIEMLVVIAIIAILVSIIIPTVSNANTKAKAAANAANLRSIKAEVVTKMLTGDLKDQAAVTSYLDKRDDEVSFYAVDDAKEGGLAGTVKDGDVILTWNGLTVSQWAEKAGNSEGVVSAPAPSA